jgi:hypothetical protein
MGKRRRRLAFPKQWRVDVARQPMKVSTAMAEKKIPFWPCLLDLGNGHSA